MFRKNVWIDLRLRNILWKIISELVHSTYIILVIFLETLLCTLNLSVFYRQRFFFTEQGLANVLEEMGRPYTATGWHIFVGGLHSLIKNTTCNWKQVVDKYVDCIATFAREKVRHSTVIVQLPWRNDSANLFRNSNHKVRKRLVNFNSY